MDTDQKKVSRKKFILWGLFSLSVLSLLGAWFGRKPKNRSVRMLTEDGRLVEVDPGALPAKRRKISDAELQKWIKR